jgi:hypothetical protein
MTAISTYLTEVSSPCVWGVNLGVIGIVTVTDFESYLKVAVLTATLVLTCLSVYLKWHNRNKPQD